MFKCVLESLDVFIVMVVNGKSTIRWELLMIFFASLDFTSEQMGIQSWYDVVEISDLCTRLRKAEY